MTRYYNIVKNHLSIRVYLVYLPGDCTVLQKLSRDASTVIWHTVFGFEGFILVFSMPWVSRAPHMDKGSWINMLYWENMLTSPFCAHVHPVCSVLHCGTTVNSKHQPTDGNHCLMTTGEWWWSTGSRRWVFVVGEGEGILFSGHLLASG